MTRRRHILTRISILLSVTFINAALPDAHALRYFSVKGSSIMALPQQGRVRAPVEVTADANAPSEIKAQGKIEQ